MAFVLQDVIKESPSLEQLKKLKTTTVAKVVAHFSNNPSCRCNKIPNSYFD